MPRQPASISPEQAATLSRAFALLQAGRPKEALSLAHGVCAAAPKTADSHHLIALSCSALSDQVGAEKAFRQALKLSPEHPQIWSNYANWLTGEKRTADALAAYRRSVRAAPDFVEGWTNMAIACLEADKPDEAVAALDRALKLAPQSPTAWQAMGNARRKAGDLKGAEAAYRKSLDFAPGNGAAWINLGIVLRLTGRPAEALPCYERAEKAGYTGPALMDARVGALIDTGDTASAHEEVKRLINSHSDHVAGHQALAQLLWEHGKTLDPDTDCCDRFRLAVEAHPENNALRTALAAFLMSARRYDESLEQIRILRRRDNQPKYVVLEANALELSGRSEEAGPLFAQAHKSFGDSAPFLNAYTRHLLKAGEWAAAARRAEKATRIAPDSQEAWASLATAWRLLGDAREEWLCDYERTIAMLKVEPPSEFSDTDTYCAALLEALEPMHKAKREPVNQSLRGGSQTAGRLFGRPDPIIAAAHDAFVRAVENHIATLPDDPRHPFFARKMRSVAIGGSWSVKLWSSGNHVNHIHPEGWMSSAFYVSLPPAVSGAGDDDRSGWIQFGQPPAELELGLPPRRVLRPEIGSVALFPSYMWHGTVPFEDESPRVTIAFDMTPAD